MFDPTAFDNIKFVLEGALYDLDLDGQICVMDRNDMINVAKLSRQLEMTIKKNRNSKSSCTVVLRADITNLAAELHPKLQSEKEAGCHIKMVFLIPEQRSFNMKILEDLQSIWGNDREYHCKIISDPLQDQSPNKIEIEVIFKRLIYEEQIEDLTVLADVILQSLDKLELDG
ncbi:hypothetical protein M3175_03960 [Robertmurraya korlensis]|uniref:hypothetical protein n=1 Tax=Robertmurraya korlensis TaxID=519977 RepID=UPI0020403BB5|nr:hypothetical protein [Robertmurraya korlensis]MCM3599874.1 hypothetical protein [Robertmurraya korlensis]